MIKRTILPVFLAFLWISVSEFARNEFLLNTYWLDHYYGLGIEFPSAPVNGLIWGLWSLLFAVAVFILSKRFSLLQTTFLSWFMAFVMMWVVIGNLGVLPFGILYLAAPLSLLEAFVAAYIVRWKF